MTDAGGDIEKQFAERLNRGDKSVIADLYDAYGDTLYGVVSKILRDNDAANDVLQEAFVNIWKYGKQYDSSKGRLFTWMINISRNKAIDKLRSKKRSGEIQMTGDSVYILENGNTTENNTDIIGLRKAVDELETDKKQLIELAYFGGYTQKEIADELNLPLGTVKTRVRSALQDLRKLFN